MGLEEIASGSGHAAKFPFFNCVPVIITIGFPGPCSACSPFYVPRISDQQDQYLGKTCVHRNLILLSAVNT